MKGKPLAGRQLCGAVGIVILAVFVYAARDLLRYGPFTGEPDLPPEQGGTGITVELAEDPDHGGIYFLPHGATIRDLFSEAGVDDAAGFSGADLDGVLHSGDRISCDAARSRVTVADMSAPTRLALGIPIDLNTATIDELALVPGIGRKMASKIVRFREKQGAFPEVDALKRIEGLGEKKYDTIKRYLFIKRPSCS